MQNNYLKQLYHDKCIDINQFLEPQSKCTIYTVHGHLRNINDKAYEPEVIAIGPYHCGKDNVKMMEYHKWRYLSLICQENKEDFDKYFSAIEPLEQNARKCYADSVSLDKTMFITMLVLDGCFIIELARKIDRYEDDLVTRMPWMRYSVERDLMLFENQIPFFVLCTLFDLIEGPNQRDRLIGLLKRSFINYRKRLNRSPNEDRERSIGLLKRFFHSICHVKEDKESSNRGPDEDRESSNRCSNEDIESSNRSPCEIKHLLHLMRITFVSSLHSDLVEQMEYRRKQFRDIKSATWLTEANVKFKKNERAHSLFDIKFEHGTMLLPRLRIEDNTESLLRNLIAYEQYFQDTQYLTDCYSCVTDYVAFLDCLIKSSTDVEILSRFGIIENWLGSDEMVAKIFNKIVASIVISNEEDFIYGEIYDKVEEHCSKNRNRWMANLRRNYLNSPWAIISVIAAALLLLLTFAQTVFSGLSHK